MPQPRIVFEGRKFRVESRQFGLAGSIHAHDIIVHPGAAVVLPVLEDGRLLLIFHQRPAVGEELLELPAGTLEDGEDPAVCAARELSEETGYRAGRLQPLVTYYSSPGILTEKMHAFLATELTAGPTARESGELIRLAPMSHPQAMQAIRQGRIIDGKTVLTLLYYDRFIHQPDR